MRRLLPVLVLVALVVLILPTAAFAAKIIYVDGSVAGPGQGTQVDPYRNIQTAIDAAQAGTSTTPGDVIIVAPGEYRSGVHFGTSISILNHWQNPKSGISLLGSGPDETVLIGSGTASVMKIDGVANVTVSGFTIRGGGPKDWRTLGGGIHLKSLSSSVQIKGNTIAGNVGNYGGGIYCEAASPTISGNIITGNAAAGYGGGIYISAAPGLEANPTIVNNVITDNIGDWGGGGVTAGQNSYPLIANNTITGNAGGIASVASDWSSNPRVYNCIVWGNGVSSRPNFSGNYTAASNISTVDPGFVDAATGNYQLRVDSPAVNSGTPRGAAWPYSFIPTHDILGAVRPQGARVDIGAYERPYSVLPVTVADGAVNVTFDKAFASGSTIASKTPLGESVAPPVGRRLLGDAHYDITSTADRVAGSDISVTLSFSDAGLSVPEKASIRLFHYTGGAWVDITTGQPNLTDKTVSGVTTSLSPFAVFYTQDTPVDPGSPSGGDEPVTISTPASSAWSIVLLAMVAIAYLVRPRRSGA